MLLLLTGSQSIDYVINHSEPLPATDYAEALIGMETLFRSYSINNPDRTIVPDGKKHKLFVHEVKSGSIITTLIPFLAQSNIIIEFANHLKNMYEYIKTGVPKETQYTINDLEALAQILNPAIQIDNSINISINDITNEDNGVINIITIGNKDAQEVIDKIREIARPDERNVVSNELSYKPDRILTETVESTEVLRKQAFKWTQINISSNTNNRGIIKSVSSRKTKVIFDSNQLKQQMISTNTNPLTTEYSVDVEITYKNNKPRLYKIIAVH